MVKAGELMVVDPNLEEEATASGLMTVIMNAFGELCAVQKTSGIGLPAAQVHMSVCLSVCPFVCLPVCLSFCLALCLSVLLPASHLHACDA